MRKMIVAAMIGMAVPALGKSPPPPLETDGFANGKTTADEVRAALGKPNASISDGKGGTVLIYTRLKSGVRAASFLPIAGFFVKRGEISLTSVTLTFGADGLLTNVAKSEASPNPR